MTRYDLPCNIAQTLNIIGDRWTMLILHELLIGTENFNEIKQKLPGLSSNVLSARLKALEEAELVTSQLYSAHPPRYSYRLTKAGEQLEHVFNAMAIWGSEYLNPCFKEVVDATTDEAVEIVYRTKESGAITEDLVIRAIERQP
ncbi:winged helix-turn-helix transcriptional regulator [Caryophanon tenue]|uniref:Transcriptional regulator n=1 Tax=Caryophanon tenue TaxID=33978 RepID=A0A1C0Y797_9BACL|nr:helix-turn-helix domain-containing protein [Caryophanon tenue]OCS83030.1 transcriptional regulator [Caryophanon tenue]